MKFGDRFEGQIYYLEAIDLFHLIDRNAKPDIDSLVAVERLPSGQIVIERYRRQAYFGVVRALKPYKLIKPVSGYGPIIHTILLVAFAAMGVIWILLDVVPDQIARM